MGAAWRRPIVDGERTGHGDPRGGGRGRSRSIGDHAVAPLGRRPRPVVLCHCGGACIRTDRGACRRPGERRAPLGASRGCDPAPLAPRVRGGLAGDARTGQSSARGRRRRGERRWIAARWLVARPERGEHEVARRARSTGRTRDSRQGARPAGRPVVARHSARCRGSGPRDRVGSRSDCAQRPARWRLIDRTGCRRVTAQTTSDHLMAVTADRRLRGRLAASGAQLVRPTTLLGLLAGR